MPLVTVFTPTYNRASFLPRLFDSLCRQTCKDFEWLIVDDGSTDGTEELFNSRFKTCNTEFNIRYYKKENGGKHTAVNRGMEEAHGKLFFIVDSDDMLTDDAISCICSDWKSVNAKEHVMGSRGLCGMSYLRGYNADKIIGDKQIEGRGNFIADRFNRGIKGDKAEVWVTRILRQYGGFKVFKGEKFISESVLWIRMARKYDMYFINKIIYITEYLHGGLSNAGRKLRFECPRGMAYGSIETMSSEFKFRVRIKECLLYIVYSCFGGWHFGKQYSYLVKTFRNEGLGSMAFVTFLFLICYMPGIFLFCYWKYKYNVRHL